MPFLGTDAKTGPGSAIQQVLHVAAESKHGALALIISFVVALVSGSSLFSAVQDAINIIWDIRPRKDKGIRVVVRNRLISGLMLFVAGVLVLASLAAGVILEIIAGHAGGWVVPVTYIGDTIVSFGVVTLLFAMIYRYLPPAKIIWSDVWLGSLTTAGLFIIGKIALTFYFRFVSLQSPYGAAGSLAALLIWIYYSGMLIFFGAAFTRVYAESQGKPIEPDQYGMKLSDFHGWASAVPIPDGQGEHPRRPISWRGLIVASLSGGLGALLLAQEHRRLRAGRTLLQLPARLARIDAKLDRAERIQDRLEMSKT